MLAGSWLTWPQGRRDSWLLVSGDRKTPTVIKTYPLGDGNSNDVRVVGNYAFVAHGTGGLKIVDIS